MIEELKQILVEEIKNTKTLQNLDQEYIRRKLNKFILTYGDIFKKLKIHTKKKGLENIQKSKPFKEIIKRVRDELRIVYGSFLTNDFHKKQIPQTQQEILETLKAHKSTKERIEFYETIYKQIFNWYTPNEIADLGCGLNPLSYFLTKQNCKYFASDLSQTDMEFIQEFFKKHKIKGTAKAYDLSTLEILNDKDFQKCDLVFLFKALDSLEQVKKNISKELLKGINAKHIIVSFPTKSLLSKKGFRIEKRNWLFNFINKENWSYQKFEIENELFILITKS